MASLPKGYVSPDEYLAIDRGADEKSEYVDGQIVAHAGASKRHNTIVANLVAGIHRQLVDKPCNVYPSDLRVRIGRTMMYAYPDVVVTCGEEEFADDQRDILLNPMVLIEVLSDSTANYDRGDKFDYYRRIASLREYVLVLQEPYRVDRHTRQNDAQWLLTEFHRAEDVLELQSVKCALTIAAIFAKT